MKDILESSEAFTAHATISAGYYMMQEAQKEFDKSSPKSPIDAMIDQSTGYAAEKLEKHISYLQICLIDIMEAKKVIEADYSNDVKMFNKLSELKTRR